MGAADQFKPFDALAEALLPHIADVTDDRSHDLSHILRVWRNVCRIAAKEGGDLRLLCAATLLHDCVDVPKDSPQRAMASRLAAQKAAGILDALNWTAGEVACVVHAIEAHSFSAAITPTSLEARIVQDADRLDAIGSIGVARCLFVSGRLNRAIYDPADPNADRRALDDQTYAIDHFQTKLLTLSGQFHTQTARDMGRVRHNRMLAFLEGLLDEVGEVSLA